MLTEFSVGILKAYKMDQERTASVCVYPAVITREKKIIYQEEWLWNLQGPDQNENADPFPLFKHYQDFQDGDSGT